MRCKSVNCVEIFHQKDQHHWRVILHYCSILEASLIRHHSQFALLIVHNHTQFIVFFFCILCISVISIFTALMLTSLNFGQLTNFLVYSYICKHIDIDVEYFLWFIVCRIVYAVFIWCCRWYSGYLYSILKLRHEAKNAWLTITKPVFIFWEITKHRTCLFYTMR